MTTFNRAHDQTSGLWRLFVILVVALILVVDVRIVANYPGYFPPDFRVDFLRGRESYFFGAYRWAFLAHLASGPVSLVLGLLLMSETVRRRTPGVHRVLGRIQVGLVALVVAPSGFFMAFQAAAGPIAGVSLGILAILTAATALIGGWNARRRRFAEHRRWTRRCIALLCSAVVLRLLGGFGMTLEITADWYDPLATWLCWLLPLTAVEAVDFARRSPARRSVQSRSPGSRA